MQEKLKNRIPLPLTVEKKWLILQLLCAISQIHGEDMNHGDIKPENILLTSYNQLFLTDMVRYKPKLLCIDDEDPRHYKDYFGELGRAERCYIAPERFVSRKEYEQWARQEKTDK